MKPDGKARVVVASPDGKWIVSGGVDRKVTIWNAISHQKASELAGEQCQTGVTALDISPDSSLTAAGSEDGIVLVWRLEGGKRIAGPLKHEEVKISSVKFSPTGDGLASACTAWGYSSIRIWDSRTGRQLACLSTDNRPTHSLAWTSDGQQLFAGGPYGSIKCFYIAGEPRAIPMLYRDQIFDSVTSLCVSNNDRFLVAGSASARSLSLWDVNTLQQFGPTFQQASEVLSVAISPDNQRLVIGTSDKRISIQSLSDIVPMAYFFHASVLLYFATSRD